MLDSQDVSNPFPFSSVIRETDDHPDPHLYYFGGDGRTGRFISRFLALQVQKELLGLPLRPYMN